MIATLSHEIAYHPFVVCSKYTKLMVDGPFLLREVVNLARSLSYHGIYALGIDLSGFDPSDPSSFKVDMTQLNRPSGTKGQVLESGGC